MIATLTDKQTELDFDALKIDIQNIRQAINDLKTLTAFLQAQIDDL